MPEDREIVLNCEPYGTDGNAYPILPHLLNQSSIVYSAGIGHCIAFEKEVAERTGARVYAFDPTEQAKNYLAKQVLPSNLLFMQAALSDVDGTYEFSAIRDGSEDYLPGSLLNIGKEADCSVETVSVQKFMQINGHTRIDLLKLDIEGAELLVIQSLLKHKIFPQQIVLEVHPHLFNIDKNKSAFSEFGFLQAKELLEDLKREQYQIFYISPDRIELSLVRMM